MFVSQETAKRLGQQSNPNYMPTGTIQEAPQQQGFLPALAEIGKALQPLGQMDTNRRNQETMMGLLANRPELAKILMDDQNQKARIQAALTTGDGDPSSVREYKYVAGLTPEQKQEYYRVKRATQISDYGGGLRVYDPVAGGFSGPDLQKTLSPADIPANAAAKAGAMSNAQNASDLAYNPQTAAATENAKVAAEKARNAPTEISSIDNNIKVIDDALNAPGFDGNFGKMGVLPNIPGGEAADARTYIDQIKGVSFLTAIGQMRGSGSISEKEGEAATSAVARLSAAQSAGSARKALADLRDILDKAKKRQEGYAAGDNTAPANNKSKRLRYNPATGSFE